MSRPDPIHHTPGPWAVVGTVMDGTCAAGIIGQAFPPVTGLAGLAAEYTVATVPYVTDESAYNASLLAAAPALLEALEGSTALLEMAIHRGLGGARARRALEFAKAASAVARARTPFAPNKT